jgi:integrase
MRAIERSKTVTLMIRAKINGKVIRTKAVYGGSGRVKPGLVVHGDKEIQLADVRYDLRYYETGKPKYKPVGNNASDAEEQRRAFSSLLTAKAVAQAAGLKVETQPERKTVKQAAFDYVARRSVDLPKKHLRRIKYTQTLFLESCKKIYTSDITQDDIAGFHKHLSETPVLRRVRASPSRRVQQVKRRRRIPTQPRMLSKRTIFNYFVTLRTWLVAMGVAPSVFSVIPRYEEPEVTVYSPEDLELLFGLVRGRLRIVFGMALKCGLRNQEVSHSYFSDIDWDKKVILVRGKPEWGFGVKNRLQRYVPIPDDLLQELREWQALYPRQSLIVPSRAGKPDAHLLGALKRFAFVHGLRCGRCEHCLSGNPECDNWDMHKFRRTYATAIVRYLDLRTAQEYLGHESITSTERYLKASSAAGGQKRVSQINWIKPFYE